MFRTITRLFLLLLILLLTAPYLTYAQNSNDDSLLINVIVVNNADVEDNPLYFSELKSDVSPYIVDGTTMIPLRALAEGFDYYVNYHEYDKKIIINDAAKESELVFTVGSTIVYKNGQVDSMFQAPLIHEDSTFIPLRYVSEFFNKYVTWNKGISGKTMYIWVSSVQLLTEYDIVIENDDNYYLYQPSAEQFPFYYLKDDGQTYRGIKIGDEYKKVVELYGEPHESFHRDGMLYRLVYRAEALPNTGSGGILTFYFSNEIVESIGVNPRW
jgi:hypothetical protein